jgi:predicted small secreted protein
MTRHMKLRILAVALLVGLALVSVACNATVGVGISVPVYGGWGGPYGGVYVGAPIWP